MSRNNHPHQLSQSQVVIRTLSVIATIAILVLCMPRSGYTNYRYSLGEPWNGSPIIAKDSFPIIKSEAQLAHEQDSLMQMYKPVFEMNPEIGAQQTAKFEINWRTKLQKQLPARYHRHIIEKLNKVYQSGILSSRDMDSLKQEKTKGVLVSVQMEAREHRLKDMFTQKSAYEYLMHEEDTTVYTAANLQLCNFNDYLLPNLMYDIERSKSQRDNVQKNLVRYSGQVMAGQKIVDRGQIVDEHTYSVLESMRHFQEGKDRSSKEKASIIIGQTLYATILMLCLLFFFQQFRSDYLQTSRTALLILLLTLSFPIIAYAMVQHDFNYVYAIPFCITPIFLRVFLDSRTAFLAHTISVLLAAFVLAQPYEFIFTQEVAGLVAIYSLKELTQRSELFRSVIIVAIVSLLAYGCFDLVHLHFTSGDGTDRTNYICILINAALLLISYLLLFPVERVFKFTSNVTLVELSNTNNTILRELSEKAPGTFQHAMQVANLASEVALRIGAKSQLVRTGALYHDIGKLMDPSMFTENQSGMNPHDRLSPVKSAEIVIGHVRYGLQLAEKHRLPQIIRDFIATHHGCSTARYFYISYQNAHPDENVNPKLFTYPGPNPHTAEQAILMMADAVEAASRSLPEYTEESVSALVDRIIDGQVKEGYFNNCPITFEDITTAKTTMKDKLKTIYHTRISYPELKKD